MNKETAEAFIIHFARKYFSHMFPQKVMDALLTEENSSSANQTIESNIFLEWEEKVSVQTYWKGVINNFRSAQEKKIVHIFKEALFSNKQLKITHLHKHKLVQIFNPFGLVLRDDKFFLVGSYENTQQPCLLNINKVSELQVLEQQAIQPPEQFNLDDFSENYLIHPTSPEMIEMLSVEFPEKAFFYVTSHPLKCEQLVISERHGVPGFFNLKAYKVKNTYLLHEWLNAFQDDAYVLEPDFIRQQINRSFVDQLTNLYNRKAFERLGSREIDHYLRELNCYFSILIIDIDHFKKINDQYGHVFGDSVLVKVAEYFRDYDAIRYGGEEFVILLSNTHATEAVCAAERIRQNIESLSLKNEEGHDVTVTISTGIAEFPIHLSINDRHILDKKENLNQKTKRGLLVAIIEQADKALYQAKQTGRNKSVIIQNDILL